MKLFMHFHADLHHDEVVLEAYNLTTTATTNLTFPKR